MTPQRSIEELVEVTDPAWPEVSAWIESAPTPVDVLPVETGSAGHVLHDLQVTASSTLGALALHTGGLIADRGWFRLLGGGGAGLPSLAAVNDLRGSAAPGHLVVGFDALGGRFAIDGGALGVAVGEVCYFGPDTLAWGGLGGGHSAFVHAVLSGGLADAFSDLRWPGWEGEVQALSGTHGLSLYPPPFTREGREIARVSRRPVPFDELLAFYADAERPLDPPSP